MKKLDKDELLNIKGGAITGTYVNAIVRGIEALLDLGRSFGSSIRRWTSNDICRLP